MLNCLLTVTDAKKQSNFISELLQNKRALVIIIVVIVVYAIIMGYLIWTDIQKKRLWSGRGTYKRKEKFSDRFFSTSYKILKLIPMTRDYIEKLSYQFRLISPCDSRLIARKTVGISLLTLIMSVLVFTLFYLINPRLITLITAAITIFIFNNEIMGRFAQNYEIKLDLELQHLLSEQIHNYYVKERVDDALYLSMDSLSSNMRVVADQIYQLLLSENRDEALREYYDNVPNKYLRQFVSLCVGVAERGDEELNGKPLYIRNLENLYSQLEIEIEKLQRLRLEFMGVMFIVILPFFGLDLVKWFCISLKDTMVTFFYGQIGFMCDLGIMTLTSFVYVVMNKSAEYTTFRQSSHRWLYALDRIPVISRALNNYCDKYATGIERLKKKLKNNGYNILPKHFILRSYLLAIAVFIISIGIDFYLNLDNRNSLLQVNISEVSLLTSAAEEKQYEDMANLITKYTTMYVLEDANGVVKEAPETTEELVSKLESENIFYNKLINEAIAKDVMRRVENYNASSVSFFEVFICFLIGVFSYFLPSLMLKYSSSVSKDAIEDEVNQFNALIGILMYDKSMTAKLILMELESYAVVFKQSIRKCINDYSSSDIMALEQLKEDEPYSSFVRIVENLIRCDDMPICEAFHEVDVEREGYLSKRKLANEKSIRKRASRAYLLAALPLLILFAYAMIPTLISAVADITKTMEELNSGI